LYDYLNKNINMKKILLIIFVLSSILFSNVHSYEEDACVNLIDRNNYSFLNDKTYSRVISSVDKLHNRFEKNTLWEQSLKLWYYNYFLSKLGDKGNVKRRDLLNLMDDYLSCKIEKIESEIDTVWRNEIEKEKQIIINKKLLRLKWNKLVIYKNYIKYYRNEFTAAKKTTDNFNIEEIVNIDDDDDDENTINKYIKKEKSIKNNTENVDKIYWEDENKYHNAYIYKRNYNSTINDTTNEEYNSLSFKWFVEWKSLSSFSEIDSWSEILFNWRLDDDSSITKCSDVYFINWEEWITTSWKYIYDKYWEFNKKSWAFTKKVYFDSEIKLSCHSKFWKIIEKNISINIDDSTIKNTNDDILLNNSTESLVTWKWLSMNISNFPKLEITWLTGSNYDSCWIFWWDENAWPWSLHLLSRTWLKKDFSFDVSDMPNWTYLNMFCSKDGEWIEWKSSIKLEYELWKKVSNSKCAETKGSTEYLNDIDLWSFKWITYDWEQSIKNKCLDLWFDNYEIKLINWEKKYKCYWNTYACLTKKSWNNVSYDLGIFDNEGEWDDDIIIPNTVEPSSVTVNKTNFFKLVKYNQCWTSSTWIITKYNAFTKSDWDSKSTNSIDWNRWPWKSCNSCSFSDSSNTLCWDDSVSQSSDVSEIDLTTTKSIFTASTENVVNWGWIVHIYWYAKDGDSCRINYSTNSWSWTKGLSRWFSSTYHVDSWSNIEIKCDSETFNFNFSEEWVTWVMCEKWQLSWHNLPIADKWETIERILNTSDNKWNYKKTTSFKCNNNLTWEVIPWTETKVYNNCSNWYVKEWNNCVQENPETAVYWLLVTVYESKDDSWVIDINIWPDIVQKNIDLFLSSYEKVDWYINNPHGYNINKVVLQWHNSQSVSSNSAIWEKINSYGVWKYSKYISQWEWWWLYNPSDSKSNILKSYINSNYWFYIDNHIWWYSTSIFNIWWYSTNAGWDSWNSNSVTSWATFSPKCWSYYDNITSAASLWSTSWSSWAGSFSFNFIPENVCDYPSNKWLWVTIMWNLTNVTDWFWSDWELNWRCYWMTNWVKDTSKVKSCSIPKLNRLTITNWDLWLPWSAEHSNYNSISNWSKAWSHWSSSKYAICKMNWYDNYYSNINSSIKCYKVWKVSAPDFSKIKVRHKDWDYEITYNWNNDLWYNINWWGVLKPVYDYYNSKNWINNSISNSPSSCAFTNYAWYNISSWTIWSQKYFNKSVNITWWTKVLKQQFKCNTSWEWWKIWSEIVNSISCNSWYSKSWSICEKINVIDSRTQTIINLYKQIFNRTVSAWSSWVVWWDESSWVSTSNLEQALINWAQWADRETACSRWYKPNSSWFCDSDVEAYINSVWKTNYPEIKKAIIDFESRWYNSNYLRNQFSRISWISRSTIDTYIWN